MHRVSQPFGVFLVMAVTASAVLAGCSPGPARVPLIIIPETGTGGSSIDSSALRTQAEAIVRLSFSQAILVEVIGTPSNGAATSATQVNNLQFRFAADRTNPSAGTAWVDSTNGQFGPVQSSSQQLTDVTFTELPQANSLEQAVNLMQNAGFTDPFRRVIFRQLPGGVASQASYAFDLGNGFVLVGAITGQVTQTASQPEPNRLVPNT